MRIFSKLIDLEKHLSYLNDSLPYFAKFDPKRAANVSWLNSKKSATFLYEPVFIKLFHCEGIIKQIGSSSGDPVKVSNLNRIETIKLLTSSDNLRLDESLTHKVLAEMADLLLLSGRKYKTVSPSEAFDSLPQNTSSSFPSFRRPKSLVKSDICSLVHKLIRTPKLKVFHNFPISVNWRTQVSSSIKLKYRQFYPFPALVAVLEKMIFNGIFSHFEKNQMTPYCMSNTFEHLSKRYVKWQTKRHIYSIDFKSFDQKIENILLSTLLKFLSSKISLRVHDIDILDSIISYHCNCLIISSINGETCMFRKKRGLMSGSALTNLLGSMVNLFTLLYLNRLYKLDVDKSSISILGDDIVFASDKKLSINDFALYYKKHFNLEISVEKSNVYSPGEQVYFLGHNFDQYGRYLNNAKTVVQLCISENYIPEEILSTNDRIWSKFCSILFKCSDGEQFFDHYKPRLMKILKLEKPIGYYYTLFNSDGDMYKKFEFESYKSNGWRSQ
jgi:hypothetical protein